MFPDCSGSNYVSFVPAYSFALAYFSSGDLYVSACVLLSFLPFACQTAHLRFSRVACNLPLFPLACQVLPTLFSIFFSPPRRLFSFGRRLVRLVPYGSALDVQRASCASANVSPTATPSMHRQRKTFKKSRRKPFQVIIN